MSCHAGAGAAPGPKRAAPACKVATSNCVSCQLRTVRLKADTTYCARSA